MEPTSDRILIGFQFPRTFGVRPKFPVFVGISMPHRKLAFPMNAGLPCSVFVR
jgi:hypothetical protein